MKQKLFILLILVVSIYQKTFCQPPPCRYQTNDSKTIITDSAAGWIIYGYVQMIRTGNDYKMHLEFRYGIDQESVTAYKIIKGQFFELFLKNKDTVSLAANETVTGVISHGPHFSGSGNTDDYTISAADIKRIMASPCTSIEINYSLSDGTPRNIDLKHPLFHNLFINLLNCVMK
ncbi:MAG TPA: hypothetical protein VEV62_13425 [Parafilimonas sp.]|nr:hypothetical protein [Parafilimonas sp.]